MKMFFEIGNRYAKQSDWKDFALTKCCLCAVGILIGMLIPAAAKGTAAIVAAIVFLITYALLMRKTFRIFRDMRKQEES